MPLSTKNTQAEQLALVHARGRRVVRSMRDAIVEISDRCAALPDLDTRNADEIVGYDVNGAFR